MHFLTHTYTLQDNPEMTTTLAITYQPTEPEETNPEPVTASIEDILHSLDISEAQGRSKAQPAEQKVIKSLGSLSLHGLLSS